MRVRVGCNIAYICPQPTPMLFVIRPSTTSSHAIVEEKRVTDPSVPIDEYFDTYGNQIWRLVAPTGRWHIEYDALVELQPTPDLIFPNLPKTAVENLPYDAILYTLPSRLCPSDMFINDAWQLFGQIEGGWAQVQAVCDWLHSNVQYGVGSISSTTAWDAYQARRGVCRDFAHLGVSFCRALNFPARYVCGYLPDIGVPFDPSPMDFHAWFEVYINGAWHTFDARHNFPRIGRILVARGRDAVDVAFSTIYGSIQLESFKVWADEVA
ncbi:MAG: transglutaminase family protein [Chloroflexota bacterium]